MTPLICDPIDLTPLIRRRVLAPALAPIVVAGAIAIILIAWVSPVSAHNDSAYSHDTEAVADNPGWMASLPNDVLLSQLSLPGTHDTMADCNPSTNFLVCANTAVVFGGIGLLTKEIINDITKAQSMTLVDQLTSGIRALDIRVKYEEAGIANILTACEAGDTDCKFALYHGSQFQGTFFETDVLQVAKTFLQQHPSETIIMRLKEETANNLLGPAMIALLDKPEYTPYLLPQKCNGSGEADTINLKLGPVSASPLQNAGQLTTTLLVKGAKVIGTTVISLDTTDLTGILPSGSTLTIGFDSYTTTASIMATDGVLASVPITPALMTAAADNAVVSLACSARGKIAILGQFARYSGEDKRVVADWGSIIPADQKQDDFTLDDNWDLHSKWDKVQAHLNTANADLNPNRLYANFLSGSGGSFPYFVASGHSSPTTGAPRLSTAAATPFFGNTKYPDFPRTTCLDLSNAFFDLEFCTISFEGTNTLTQNCLKGNARDYGSNEGPDIFACGTNTKQYTNRIGMVFADFPGKGLIEEIIAVNVDANGLHLNPAAPNLPPTASLSQSSYIGDEGSLVTFDASASFDPDGDSLVYRWELLGNRSICERSKANLGAVEAYQAALEQFEIDNSSIPSAELDKAFATSPEGKLAQQALDDSQPNVTKASFVCSDDDQFQVKVTVTDTSGASSEATSWVTITNVAPTINGILVLPASIVEGNSVAVKGTFTDPALDFEIYSGSALWSDGVTTSLTVGAGTFTTSRNFPVDQLTAAYLVTVDISINDDDVGSDIETSPVLTIIVTPQSIINAVNKLHENGVIKQKTVESLMSKLKNAMKKHSQGQCKPSGNMYGAFINEVEAQTGKSITPMAAAIVIQDAEYLIEHCL